MEQCFFRFCLYNSHKNFINCIMLRSSLIFFLFCSLSFGQNNTINDLSIDSRENGTIIELKSTKKIDLKKIAKIVTTKKSGEGVLEGLDSILSES